MNHSNLQQDSEQAIASWLNANFPELCDRVGRHSMWRGNMELSLDQSHRVILLDTQPNRLNERQIYYFVPHSELATDYGGGRALDIITGALKGQGFSEVLDDEG